MERLNFYEVAQLDQPAYYDDNHFNVMYGDREDHEYPRPTPGGKKLQRSQVSYKVDEILAQLQKPFNTPQDSKDEMSIPVVVSEEEI